jgi:lysophospholipase L1-like esterase
MATRNLVFSVILLIVSLLFSLIVAEMGLRLLGYAGAPESLIGNIRHVDDPILNWRFVPNSTVQDGNVVSHYNSAGFHDREHATAKPVGMTRIVVVGDSVTEGGGISEEQLFVNYVQALLGSGYEVINLAMSGLNTPQEIHLLEVEGLKYEPDVVVLNFVLNDCDFFTELHAVERFQNQKNSKIGLFGDLAIDPRFKQFLKSSALIYFVKGRVEHLLGLISGKGEKNYYTALWDNPQCRKRILPAFDSLQRLQQQHGFAVHVLIWPLLLNYEHYEFTFIHEWVTQMAEQRGFKVLDLLPVYSPKWYRDLQITAEDNIHPNGVGHRLSAQAYVDWSRQSSTLSSQ